MKSNMFLLVIALCAVAELAVASDESTGITFVPSIAYQHKRLSFDQKYTDNVTKPINENGRKSNFDVDLPTLNVSLTAAMSGFYITLKLEKSLADASVIVDETRPPSRSALSDPYYLNVPNHNTQVERLDRSITLGYNVWSGLNIFGGYMWGETNLTPDPGCYVFPVVCSGRNLASDHEEQGVGPYHQKYTEQGPYVGFSYGWSIADAGTLSLSAAYAQMDGRFQDNYYALGDEHFNFIGDSTGSSFGLTWSSPLGESSAYFLDIRQQKYSMHGKDHNTPSAYLDSVEVKTDETMLGLTAGLQLYF